jgi:cellulose synthase/poly-beta-1,6-N-acetylglucosamine synthase-like glycosyltransferase
MEWELLRLLGPITFIVAMANKPSTDSSLHSVLASICNDGLVRVSVVVPTCRRPQLLGRCLAALVKQRLDPESFEIIVVDDAPCEETRTMVKHWIAISLGRGPVIGYLPSPGPHGPAAARNLGWRAAQGEIIAFTDDDTIPDRDWLLRGLGAFRERAQAAWGRVVMPLPPRRPTDYERDAQGLERGEFATANCFCLRSVLEVLDGFDERFRLAWREDADLYFRLLRCNARVVHVPEAVVVHPVCPAPWGISLTQQRKVLFDALLYKKHPAFYREKIRRAARWDYYAIVVALLLFLSAAATQNWLLAGMAASVWLGLTVRFCYQRLSGTSKAFRHIAEMIVTSALIPPISVFWRIIGATRFRAAFL